MRLENAVAVVFEPDHSVTPVLGLIPRMFSGSGTGLGMRLPSSVKWSLWEFSFHVVLAKKITLFVFPLGFQLKVFQRTPPNTRKVRISSVLLCPSKLYSEIVGTGCDRNKHC